MTNLDKMLDQITRLLKMRGLDDERLDKVIRDIISDNLMQEPAGLIALHAQTKL